MTEGILTVAPECEIVASRIIKASRKNVFTAWTDPELLKQWWGPAGFTNTFHQFDLKPGGRWKFTMHGPDKGNYQNECEFIVIDEPGLIAWNRISKPIFQVVATFEEVGEGETKVVFKQVFTSEAECEKIRKFVVDKNEENFDRLETVLAKMDQ